MDDGVESGVRLHFGAILYDKQKSPAIREPTIAVISEHAGSGMKSKLPA
jgi:hypothetical protein